VLTAFGRLWRDESRRREQEDEARKRREQEKRYRLQGRICALGFSFIGMIFYTTKMNFLPNSWWDDIIICFAIFSLLPQVSVLCTNYVVKISS